MTSLLAGETQMAIISMPTVVTQIQSGKLRADAPRRRILIADDNRDSADSMGMILRATGHEVEVVYDGLEAVSAARRMRPEVMVLDIGMPGMNGYDVAQAVRREPWSADTAIIALTGWGQDTDRQRSKDAGIDMHLVKPVEFDRLEAAVLHQRQGRVAAGATPR
jgi:CheY-like chemotaxis protein